MLDCYVTSSEDHVIPIELVVSTEFIAWLNSQESHVESWVNISKWTAKPGAVCFLGNQEGKVDKILLGISATDDVWSIGVLPSLLPVGTYRLQSHLSGKLLELAIIAWGLGSYQFNRYRSTPINYDAKLLLPKNCRRKYIENVVDSIYFIRDLINTPAEDMSPAELADIANNLAEEFAAKIHLTIGDDLLKKGYPAIHTVGRASNHAPRLIDLHWGDKSNPHIVLVGKGVCFDSGGINIKPASGMMLMKKDMAGAAHALGLARMIMTANLPIYLRVLIPAVENSVSGSSYHPGDVIKTRQGLYVEVTNTDAEGRLILADSLTEGVKGEPDLIIDIATLTGAARVALGPEVSGFFTEDEELAKDLEYCAQQEQDPVWRLPLYRPYRSYLDSTIADISNANTDPIGPGAITAALFLKEFVPSTIPWLHLDIMAWNPKFKPSRPIGGEAMAVRALYHYLEMRFGKKADG